MEDLEKQQILTFENVEASRLAFLLLNDNRDFMNFLYQQCFLCVYMKEATCNYSSTHLTF